MGRPRDVTKWLTGFIGYAQQPRPDVLRPANRLAVARNVWLGGTKGLAQRRGGMGLAITLTSDTISATTLPVFMYDRTYSTMVVYSGTEYVTTQPGTGVQISWASTPGYFTQGVALNRRGYLVPSSSTNQHLDVIDLNLLGYSAAAAPTLANTGAGAYAATLRYYRVQFSDNSNYAFRGPVGPAASVTPSGAGTGIEVTRPSLPSLQFPTHWILWASADGVTYYRLATTVVATTTYTDTTAPASYSGVTGDVLEDPLRQVPHRWVGLPQPAVPSIANTGAGAYAATLRYYRVRWAEYLGSTQTRRGEPSTSVSFTPSGAGTAARITAPSGPTSTYGATHWEIEASTDNVNFYLLTTKALGTTTYDDSAATTTYSAGTVSETVGDYTEPPTCRAIAVDRDRVLFAGGWTENLSRVWYTPVLGSPGLADEERVPTDNYVDVEAHDDDEIRAVVGPIGGAMLVFKRRSIFRLVRTGNVEAPYEVIKIAEGLGCEGVDHVCLGMNASNSESAYFANTQGAYRYDPNEGITRLSDDLHPAWDGASPGGVLYRVLPYPQRNAILFGEYAFDIASGGWTWQDWTRGSAKLQMLVRRIGYEQAYLYLPSFGATADGVYLADSDLTTTDADSQTFSAEIRTNRLTLSETTRRWRPVRLRVWGTGGALTCKLYTASRDVTAGLTALTTVNFTLGSEREEYDLTELALSGPVEFVAVAIEDAATPAVWALEAIELTGLPGEPVP